MNYWVHSTRNNPCLQDTTRISIYGRKTIRHVLITRMFVIFNRYGKHVIESPRRNKMMMMAATNDMTSRIDTMESCESFKNVLHGLLCLNHVARMTVSELLESPILNHDNPDKYNALSKLPTSSSLTFDTPESLIVRPLKYSRDSFSKSIYLVLFKF